MRGIGSFCACGAIVGAIVEIIVGAIGGELVGDVVVITLTTIHNPISATVETNVSAGTTATQRSIAMWAESRL